MTAERAALLLPLLNAQPWLHAKHFAAGELRSDFDGFRDHMRSAPCIAGAHLSAIGCQRDGGHAEAVQRPWLTVPQATPLPEGRRVVFVRSHRYKSHDFPWTDLVEWFGDMAVFMGIPGEWQTFCRDHPRAVDRVLYLPTGDLLEAAQYIAAADFCVANQTSLFGVMEGLKKPRVLESYSPVRNCEYGSRSCLAVHPGDRVTPERIIELMGAPHTV